MLVGMFMREVGVEVEEERETPHCVESWLIFRLTSRLYN